MSLAVSTAQLPVSAEEDIAYVKASFRPMHESVKPLVGAKLLPRATYVLPDGTPMVPADHAQLPAPLLEAGSVADWSVVCLFSPLAIDR